MPRTRNQIRIIGGKWKRRKLHFPDRPDLRPSLDRARETAFNWLAPHLPHSRCLDLFAGSGALGFEAASRGAAAVTLVEQDNLTARSLKQNRERLQATECEVVRASAIGWLKQQTQPWDIVFLDPPFRSSLAHQALELLLEQSLLTSSALILLESDPQRKVFEQPSDRVEQLVSIKDKTLGATRIQILTLL